MSSNLRIGEQQKVKRVVKRKHEMMIKNTPMLQWLGQ